jgi:D-glycerate 3-kinase
MQSVNECFDKVKGDYLKFLNKEKIYKKSMSTHIKNLKQIYIPTAFWINSKYEKKGKTLFIGLSGGQGTGKTTITGILKIILKKFFKRKIHISSIDDFYKNLKERNKMSYEIHPLFKTRGVPGTHDISLLKNFFNFIKKKKFKPFLLPKFDKSTDDRIKKRYWPRIKEKPEIVILEGWCVGAKSQKKSVIKKHTNLLEKNEDKDLIWRKYINQKLKKEYKKLFSMIDHFIFMKVPSFKMVFKWRLLQENKLKKKSYTNKKIMTYNEIKRFIMFYERITLQMIQDLSRSASVIMFLKKNHDIKKIFFK